MDCEMFQIVTNCQVIDAYGMQRRPLTYVTFCMVLPVPVPGLRHQPVTGRNAIKLRHIAHRFMRPT
jgi:hypothetical protein